MKDLKNNGIIRKIDELGRVVIPIDYRTGVFTEESIMYIYKAKNYVILSKNNDKGLGIKIKFDELGRANIDIQIRKDLNWKEGDYIFIWIIGDNEIGLKKVEHKCIFCDRKDNLDIFNDKFICNKCMRRIKEM